MICGDRGRKLAEFARLSVGLDSKYRTLSVADVEDSFRIESYTGGNTEIIGNEMVGQRLRDTLQYNLTTLAEERLEMLGLVLFIYALLQYMRGPGANAVDASLELR